MKQIYSLLLMLLTMLPATAQDADNFFSDKPATITGRWTDFGTDVPEPFIVYAHNVITDESIPVTVAARLK